MYPATHGKKVVDTRACRSTMKQIVCKQTPSQTALYSELFNLTVKWPSDQTSWLRMIQKKLHVSVWWHAATADFPTDSQSHGIVTSDQIILAGNQASLLSTVECVRACCKLRLWASASIHNCPENSAVHPFLLAFHTLCTQINITRGRLLAII